MRGNGGMMTSANAYAQYSKYADNKIMAASPAELTLMLYEGAIKFCNMGIIAVEQNNIERSNNDILRTERIIQYLSDTLDTKYPVAKDFDNVYTYLLQRLAEANASKDKAILEEVLGHLHTMRDTWKKVMSANAEQGSEDKEAVGNNRI